MKVNCGLKKVLSGGCVVFTILITLLYTVGYFLKGDFSGWIPTFRIMCIVFLFSFLLSGADMILTSKKGSFPIKLFLHLSVCVAGFYFIFLIGGGYYNDGRTVLTAMLVFLFAYIVCMAVRLSLRGLFSRKKRDKSEKYTPAFK